MYPHKKVILSWVSTKGSDGRGGHISFQESNLNQFQVENSCPAFLKLTPYVFSYLYTAGSPQYAAEFLTMNWYNSKPPPND